MTDDVVDLAKYGNVPTVRKKAENEPEPLKLDFHIESNPTLNDEGQIIAPPHWEVIDKTSGEKMAWGPMESAGAMWRLFCIVSIATQIIPTHVLEEALRAMQAHTPTGGIVPTEVVDEQAS